MKIKFRNIDTLHRFVADAQSLPFDINVSDGSIVLDGKSFLSLVNLDFAKTVNITPITKDWDQIDQFYGTMWKYREDV